MPFIQIDTSQLADTTSFIRASWLAVFALGYSTGKPVGVPVLTHTHTRDGSVPVPVPMAGFTRGYALWERGW